MASISDAVRRVKDGVQDWISEDLVRRACQEAGHAFRERVLPPWEVVRLFVQQVLWGNIACRAVRHLSDAAFSAQAYCQARKRLPLDVLVAIAAALTHKARRESRDFGRWKGHRVLHMDGTGLSMPDEPALRAKYGQPGGQKPGCGFPVMHVLWLFDAATGLIIDFIEDKCHTHDMAHAAGLHAQMEEGDVVVADRAFASYAHLALLLQGKLHGVFCAHQRRIINFTPKRKRRGQHRKPQRKGAPDSRWIKSLGDQDQLVEYFKPDKRPAWMDAEEYDRLPPSITVRELRYEIESPGFRPEQITLVTTLLDADTYTKQELAELYAARWRIETNLKHLKDTMGMDVLHSKTVEGVQKELWVYLIVYNQVRLFMLKAARRQGVDPQRLSFIDALDALRHRGPRDAANVRLTVHPLRPGRHEPRVIKRRKDRYTYMTKPRDELRQMLGIRRVAA